ncbi:Ni2+-binding GTPase involved in regulation of expression and maturation of urease and hydrogenase [Halanaeroarchaeum sp. HSR-CO]|uniref:hydrogenase nickel incorporation protein HypB n=1 Tax=Halanaeroarchaeum sp. HSR-CO TaxID=2866382 RepID=UPI00217D8605|nr:hydrogenase nickel incorporation protein HypB [Halanaeroarchaeum sp. HSR-CO]UWG47167.1 Ni2+-binding GTPase involved in regulation of expression and maturation of urease and hydrogenase [Halanaeroarchaeum sp. HSR-CO]
MIYDHHIHPNAPPRTIEFLVDSLLERIPVGAVDGGVVPALGPLRAHRFGHDEDAFSDADVNDDVLEAYRQQAVELHDRFVHDHGVFVVEFLGSTGSGKTSLIERLVDRSDDPAAVGVIVGDVAGEDDAERLRDHGATVATVNTGRECHLDRSFIEAGLEKLDPAALDTLFIENVGNMVCPADVPLGAQARILVVSTTEGDDVVRKHPLLVQAADAAVINKVDLADAVGADLDRMLADVEAVAGDVPTFPTSVERGDGLESLFAYVDEVERRGHAPTEGDHVETPARPSEADPTGVTLDGDQ